jgi:hypothetical protein
MEHFYFYTSLILSVYEVLSRVVPTSKTWSIIGAVINAAKAISDKLDKKK